jgi:hypothetical protein
MGKVWRIISHLVAYVPKNFQLDSDLSFATRIIGPNRIANETPVNTAFHVKEFTL